MIMIFLDPDNKILSLCSKQSLTGSRTTGEAPPDTHICLYDPAEED